MKIKFLKALFLLLSFSTIFFVYKDNNYNQTHVAGIKDEVKPVSGLILPHHDLARPYIIETLNTLSKTQNFSTIVLIGPNHFQSDSNQFLSTTTLLNYQLDNSFIQDLVDNRYFSLDQSLCQNDHSLTTPLLYLKHYFPDAKFIPILSPQYFKRQDIKNLASTLSSNLPKDTLFVASIDFSHNNTLLKALEKNRLTNQIIKNFDYHTLFKLDDSFLDSPSSAGLLLNIMQNLNSTSWSLLYDSHGSLIEDKPNMQSTSYLIGTFD